MKTIPLFVGDEDGLRDVVKLDGRVRRAGEFDSAFGHMIKLRRVALKLTQVEMAEHCGMHQVTLCRYETGTVPISSKARAKILSVLDALEK